MISPSDDRISSALNYKDNFSPLQKSAPTGAMSCTSILFGPGISRHQRRIVPNADDTNILNKLVFYTARLQLRFNYRQLGVTWRTVPDRETSSLFIFSASVTPFIRDSDGRNETSHYK